MEPRSALDCVLRVDGVWHTGFGPRVLILSRLASPSKLSGCRAMCGRGGADRRTLPPASSVMGAVMAADEGRVAFGRLLLAVSCGAPLPRVNAVSAAVVCLWNCHFDFLDTRGSGRHRE